MKQLLSDYTFSPTLRYENHQLHYTPEGDCELVLTGMLAASIMATLLHGTDEGEQRSIALSTPEQQNQFYDRYEQEVIRDNGGLLLTETQSLSESYIQLVSDDNLLLSICGNDRMLDMTLGLTVRYMQRLTLEQVGTHIYDIHPFHEPFAQWLFDAGFIETRRQHLLSIEWDQPDQVYALAQTLTNAAENEHDEPTFFFDGLQSEQLLERYFHWLWDTVQQQTGEMPDAKILLEQNKPIVLEQETQWDFIKPELSPLSDADKQLFDKWMNRWTSFITDKLTTPADIAAKTNRSRQGFKQKLFLDNYLVCPSPQDTYPYSKVREYIRERCKYDEQFKTMYFSMKLNEFCKHLSAMFGWYVDDNSLGKSINRKPIK